MEVKNSNGNTSDTETKQWIMFASGLAWEARWLGRWKPEQTVRVGVATWVTVVCSWGRLCFHSVSLHLRVKLGSGELSKQYFYPLNSIAMKLEQLAWYDKPPTTVTFKLVFLCFRRLFR